MTVGDHRTIGQAARLAGVSAKSIRLYESRGLLPPAPRSAQGHRLFTQADVETLRFIARAKAAGLQLSEIKTVLELHRDGHTPCEQVRATLGQRLTELDTMLAELSVLRDRIQNLLQHGDAGVDPGSGFCALIQSQPAPAPGTDQRGRGHDPSPRSPSARSRVGDTSPTRDRRPS